MNVLGLCSGGGGLELGISLASGGRARGVCYVEREAFAISVLVAQMEQGHMAPAPIWTDLVTFDGRPWRGVVDLLCAGFPCQPFSVAGKQLGTADERWLWPHIERIIREVGPRLIVLENVPGIVAHGAGEVLGSLSELGYDAEWGVVGADDVGATHRRKRWFCLAYRDRRGLEGFRVGGLLDGEWAAQRDGADGCGEGLADALRDRRGEDEPPEAPRRPHAVERDACVGNPDSARSQGRRQPVDGGGDQRPSGQAGAALGWPPRPNDAGVWRRYLAAGGSEPALCRGADGMADRVDRLRLLGNGVVPLQAAYAIRTLAARALSASDLIDNGVLA